MDLQDGHTTNSFQAHPERIPKASRRHPEGQKTSRISIFTCDSKVQTIRNKHQAHY